MITWWIVAVNGKMAMVTLCNFPSPGILHLPSMINETDVTSFIIATVSFGWYGYCGGSDGVVVLRRPRRIGLRLLRILLSNPPRIGELRLAGLALEVLCLRYRAVLLSLLLLLLLLLLILDLGPGRGRHIGLRLRYVCLGLLGRPGLVDRGLLV